MSYWKGSVFFREIKKDPFEEGLFVCDNLKGYWQASHSPPFRMASRLQARRWDSVYSFVFSSLSAVFET